MPPLQCENCAARSWCRPTASRQNEHKATNDGAFLIYPIWYNEAENLNTKTVERGSKLVYQVWLDTTKFDAANKDNIQTVGISDNYDEAKLNLNKADIKAYSRPSTSPRAASTWSPPLLQRRYHQISNGDLISDKANLNFVDPVPFFRFRYCFLIIGFCFFLI